MAHELRLLESQSPEFVTVMLVGAVVWSVAVLCGWAWLRWRDRKRKTAGKSVLTRGRRPKRKRR